MEVFEAIKTRRSIRKYKSIDVKEDEIRLILDAARLSPSPHNRQPWKFVIIRDAEIKRRLADVCISISGRRQEQVEKAPVVIVACGIPKESGKVGSSEEGYVFSVAIALQTVVLAATSLGLGTCWVGSFDEEKVKDLLEIPNELRVVALLTVGYPDEVPGPKSRKGLDEIVSYEKYA